jgi:hypothetical protein
VFIRPGVNGSSMCVGKLHGFGLSGTGREPRGQMNQEAEGILQMLDILHHSLTISGSQIKWPSCMVSQVSPGTGSKTR